MDKFIPLLIVSIIAVLMVLPTVKILRRMGYNPWWAIVTVISPLNLIGLWYLAYAVWPAEPRGKSD